MPDSQRSTRASSLAQSELSTTQNAKDLDVQVGPFVTGKLLQSGSDTTFEVVNPSNGQHLLSIPSGCDTDVDVAVASARQAFVTTPWGDGPLSFRKKTLHRFAELIHADASRLDALDAEEMGKPVGISLFNAAAAGEYLHFYAESVDKICGDVYGGDKTTFVAQRRIPRGVVAAIVPWNFPTFNAVLKFAPALAAGNCMVLKPSELASRSAMLLANLGMQAGLPSGVLNVVPGLGQTVGRAMALHTDVDMVTFTGSTDVGKWMLQYAGQSNMKAVMTECGGKSPQIVFADGVDLDAASASIAGALLVNQGQYCNAGSRVLVERSIERELIDKVTARMKNIVMGDALDTKTTFGPVVSSKQCARVMQYVDTASTEGAELVMGGKRSLTHTGGYFVEPTVFRNVAPKSRLAQEEVFGPVLSVIPFDQEAEAVAIANGTRYGLSAYVWTANLSTGMRMAKSIRSTVIINAAAQTGEGPGHAMSYEPMGQSGIGTEGGLAGMESYMRRQLVYINHA